MYKRELSLDNVFLCLLVIYIHVMSNCVSHLPKESPLYYPVFISWRLTAFVVPGFLFLSALRTMYWYRDQPMDYGSYYRSRVTRILLPYAVVACLYYALFVRLGWFPFSWKDLGLYILHGDIAAPFYFIIIILQLYILMPLWRRMADRVPPGAGMAAALILTLLYRWFCAVPYGQTAMAGVIYPDNLFLKYLIYWVAGCYAGKYYEVFSSLLAKYRKIWIAVYLACAAADAVWSVLSYGSNRIPGLETFHMVYCVAAILCLCSVCLWITDRGWKQSRLVSEIDAASFEIYLIHCLILDILLLVYLEPNGITGPLKQLPVLAVGVYVLSILTGMVWTRAKRGLRALHAEKQ